MELDERLAKARDVLGVSALPPKTRCASGKRMYADQAEARRQAHHHEGRIGLKKKNVRLAVYHCKKCGWWHTQTKAEG